MSTAQEYPMTLRRVLSICLPRLTGRTGEKFNVYREFISANITWEGWVKARGPSKVLSVFRPTKDEVDAQFAFDKAKPFTEPEARLFQAAFQRWYQTWHAAVVSTARRNAARAMHAKAQKSAKKPRRRRKLKKRL